MKCLICGAQLTLVEKEAERASKPYLLRKCPVQEVEPVGLPGHYQLGCTEPTVSEAEGPEAAAMLLSGRLCSDFNCGART